jgi:DNA-binding CsgD family transcriptional regulator
MGKTPRNHKRRSPKAFTRKRSQTDRFNAMVLGSVTKWHGYQEGLKLLDQQRREDPIELCLSLGSSLRRIRRILRGLLRSRFGIKVDVSAEEAFRAEVSGDKVRPRRMPDYDPLPRLRVIRPERSPANPYEQLVFWETLTSYALAEVAYAAARDVGFELRETADYERPVVASVMCQIIVSVLSMRPVFAGVGMEKNEGWPPHLQELAVARMTGWVRSRISLEKNKRLRSVLEEEGLSLSDMLLQELPAATLIEWSDAPPKEPIENIVNRVTRRLVREGNEAKRLGQKGKLADVDPGSVLESKAGDFEWEEFIAREELRALTKAAKLSKQEHQVLLLALEDRSDQAIAEKLNLTVNSVKTVKKRARKKLKQAAGQ